MLKDKCPTCYSFSCGYREDNPDKQTSTYKGEGFCFIKEWDVTVPLFIDHWRDLKRRRNEVNCAKCSKPVNMKYGMINEEIWCWDCVNARDVDI